MITLLVQLLSGLTSGLASQNISGIQNLKADKIVFSTISGEDNSFTSSEISQQQLDQWDQDNSQQAYPLGITTTKAKSQTTQAAITLFGVSPRSPIHDSAQQLDPGDVIVSQPAAKDLEIQAGDTLSLSGQDFRVSDVRGDDYYSHTPVVWVDTQTWEGLNRSSDPGIIGTVLVVPDPGDVHTPKELSAVSDKDSLNAMAPYVAENSSLQLMRGFLFVISALVVGAFFTVWTIQRSRDISVLKALGASTKRLLLDALAQAAIILVLAITAATLVALLLGFLAQKVGVPFVLSMSTFLTPAFGLFVLGLAGAFLAVRRISSVDPLIALGSAQ